MVAASELQTKMTPQSRGLVIVAPEQNDKFNKAQRQSIFRNSVSLTTRRPSFFAFSNLLPGSCPAKTNEVFLLTLPLTFPPCAMISSAISSRDWLRLPVITHVVPFTFEADSPAL